MGQAKRRGTFNQRKAVAVEKIGIDRELFKQQERERLANMTKEARQAKRDKELAFAQYISMCLFLGELPYKISR